VYLQTLPTVEAEVRATGVWGFGRILAQTLTNLADVVKLFFLQMSENSQTSVILLWRTGG
ncbi:MAG: hypothetical protein ACPGVB_16300, partial [Chitinophagales bacterium]